MRPPIANDNQEITGEFLSELTELCARHKIGIEGGELYLMEPEDFAYHYVTDHLSRLKRE